MLAMAFNDSQFNYASIIWMFCNEELYNKIKTVHYKALKVVYQSNASYDDLLDLSGSSSIHQKHLWFLMTEIFKSTVNVNPQFMWTFFQNKDISYNLRRGPVLFIPPAKSTRYGTNSIQFRGSLVWNNLPSFIKTSSSVAIFKKNIKSIGNIECGCLICRD